MGGGGVGEEGSGFNIAFQQNCTSFEANAFTRTVTRNWVTSRINQHKRSLNEISDRPRFGLSPVKSNMVN